MSIFKRKNPITFIFFKLLILFLLFIQLLWFLVAICGIYFPNQGTNPGPLHCEHRVLASGPPGKSLPIFLNPVSSTLLFPKAKQAKAKAGGTPSMDAADKSCLEEP